MCVCECVHQIAEPRFMFFFSFLFPSSYTHLAKHERENASINNILMMYKGYRIHNVKAAAPHRAHTKKKSPRHIYTDLQ